MVGDLVDYEIDKINEIDKIDKIILIIVSSLVQWNETLFFCPFWNNKIILKRNVADEFYWQNWKARRTKQCNWYVIGLTLTGLNGCLSLFILAGPLHLEMKLNNNKFVVVTQTNSDLYTLDHYQQHVNIIASFYNEWLQNYLL